MRWCAIDISRHPLGAPDSDPQSAACRSSSPYLLHGRSERIMLQLLANCFGLGDFGVDDGILDAILDGGYLQLSINSASD